MSCNISFIQFSKLLDYLVCGVSHSTFLYQKDRGWGTLLLLFPYRPCKIRLIQHNATSMSILDVLSQEICIPTLSDPLNLIDD